MRRITRHRAAAAVAGAWLLTLATTGCAATEESLQIEYVDISAQGFIDQVVHITNDGNQAVVPTISYVALDGDGTRLEGVAVTTAYGSDTGMLVIPAGDIGIDILMFSGDGAAEVRDVEANVKASVPSGYPVGAIPATFEITPIAAGGEAVTKYDPFVRMTIANPYPDGVSIRVVCLVYGITPPGESEQVAEVLQVTGRVELQGSSSLDVPVEDDVAGVLAERGYGCESLKAYLTP